MRAPSLVWGATSRAGGDAFPPGEGGSECVRRRARKISVMSVVLRGVSFVVLASACAPASPAPSRVDVLARIPTVAISSAPPPPATVETPEPVAPPSFAPVPGFPHAVKVSVPPSVAVALDTWGDGACALTKDRAVWCWDAPKPDSPEGRSPKRVDGVDGAELLSNGRGHVCAGDDRSVVSW